MAARNAIRKDIERQLIEAGEQKAFARDNATLYARVIENLANQAGIKPDKLHEKYRPIVSRGLQDGMHGRGDPSGNDRFIPHLERDTFKQWSGGAEVVTDESHKFRSETPVVIAALHGTSSDFEQFSLDYSMVSSDLGAGFYATNSIADVNINYAGTGSDLAHKLERVAENLANQRNLDPDDEEIQREAAAQLGLSNDGFVMPIWIKMRRPFVIGGPHETVFDSIAMPEDEGKEQAEYGAMEILRFVECLKEAASCFGREEDAQYLVGALIDSAYENDEIGARVVAATIRSDDHFQERFEDHEGNYAANEVFRYALEIMGFDGIIDHTVHEKFGRKPRGRGMDGMDEDTTHFVVFSPNQIKSRLGNNGDFSLESDNILKQSSTRNGLARRAPATEAFREWHGKYAKSRARGIFYHKTDRSFDAFSPDYRELGFHFGTLGQAEGMARHADNRPGTNVMPVWLSIRNPLRLEDEGSFHADAIADQLVRKKIITKELARKIKREVDTNWRKRKEYDEKIRGILQGVGYDGIVYRNTQEDASSGDDSWIAFEPTQIKSAIGNNGNYSPDQASLLEQRSRAPSQEEEARGFIRLGKGEEGIRKIEIVLLENADRSTFMHEAAHLYLEIMADLSEKPYADRRIGQDFAIVMNWLGIKSRQELTADHHERFARGFEFYLMEGRAPAKPLAQVFKRFSGWLKSIYRKSESLGVTLSDDIRGVFDRLHVGEPMVQSTTAREGMQNHAG